jgi:hypothetical protein
VNAHLNNKVEDDWKSLAFGGTGTYNPANREKGVKAPLCSTGHRFSWPPARKAGISEQDWTQSGPDGMQLLLSVRENVSEKITSQRSKEPY